MKVLFRLAIVSGALLGLASCASQTVHQDPYAVNHTAPAATDREPASSQAGIECDNVKAVCQAGDSYDGEKRSPASEGATCKKEVFECQSASVSCKDSTGAQDTADTMKYVSVMRDCQ